MTSQCVRGLNESIVISYEYVYVSEGRYNSFYHLALYNLVLGFMRVILLKSKMFK